MKPDIAAGPARTALKSRLPQLRVWHEAGYVSYPWRKGVPGKRDPYPVWIAEVMAQQTRLATVVPYFEHWMQTFPRLQDVAAATEQEILKAWEGLGYYRRALNLHKAARLIMERHGAQIPAARDALLALPGIGRYTAGAILSLCFDRPEPAVDANVVRLFSRLLAKPLTQGRPRDIDEIDRIIRDLLRPRTAMSPGMLAEALMVLGSRVCVPRTPRCPECPLAPSCLTFVQGADRRGAPKSRKADVAERHFAGFFLEAHVEETRCVLLVRNRESGMLGGLWSFPALPLSDSQALSRAEIRLLVRQALHLEVWDLHDGPRLVQGYSHFRRRQSIYRACTRPELPAAGFWTEARWVPITELQTYPMSVIDQKMAQAFRE